MPATSMGHEAQVEPKSAERTLTLALHGRYPALAVVCSLAMALSCGSSKTSRPDVTTPTHTPAPTEISVPAEPSVTSTLAKPISPSIEEIGLQMSRTVEGVHATTHFTAQGEPLTIPDGEGGWLTAIQGVRYPTADGYGQLVFFWRNATFLGWDSKSESNVIKGISSAGPGAFSVTFEQYAESDALCCPSLPDVSITFRWDGTSLNAESPIPASVAQGPAVQLLQ